VISGFLAVDKPSGITSHDVVAAVRRATGIRKSGHAGTLDPMATGLVVVALGRATRLIRFVQEGRKEYFATARFGVATDSLDADGEVTERLEMDVSLADVRQGATTLVGEIMQVPPMVSALKVGGRRLYELAREGQEVERQARPVRVDEFEVLSVGDGPNPDVTFRVICGKGTYVRVLADDLARRFGGRAHLTDLRRTRSGSFDVSAHGVSLAQLEDEWSDAVIDPAAALTELPLIEVDAVEAEAVAHGRPLQRTPFPEGTIARVVDGEGALLAVSRVDADATRAEVVTV
jgi:tRNA pseudouridine55 synthase